jgi:hypothetical protein
MKLLIALTVCVLLYWSSVALMFSVDWRAGLALVLYSASYGGAMGVSKFMLNKRNK